MLPITPSITSSKQDSNQQQPASSASPGSNHPIVNLEVCGSLHQFTPNPSSSLQTSLEKFHNMPDNFQKAKILLEQLKPFQTPASLEPEAERFLKTLLNAFVIPLCKKGLIPIKALKPYEHLLGYIEEEHTHPKVENLINPTSEERIDSLTAGLLKRETSQLSYDEEGVLALLHQHIYTPYSVDYLRFIETNLIAPGSAEKLGPRPIVYQFLHHFIPKAVKDPDARAQDNCLYFSLLAKNLASCLEVYSGASPFETYTPENQLKLDQLLHHAVHTLYRCNQELWIFVYQGIYDMDNLVYTLTTILDFHDLFKDDYVSKPPEDLASPLGIHFNQATLVNETIQKLNMLVLAFRFGISPLRSEMKNEAVAQQIEDFINNFRAKLLS